MLPYFKKLETDADYGEPLHGKSGPVPIQRHRQKDWTGYTRTMAKIFTDMGYAMREDQNGTWADGVFPTTFNVDPQGTRGSAALVYLSAEVRRRANLTVLTETPLDRLVITGGRVEAARFTRGNGESLEVTARQVIVSAGALQSPVVLMRSGIGPGAHLSERGIAVQVDRPGVGQNLQEHPNIGISGYLHRSARLKTREVHHLQALLRYSSKIEGVPPGDMHVAIAARGGWHAVGQRIGTLGFWVNRSYSTGQRAAVGVAGQAVGHRLPHAVGSTRHGAAEGGVPDRGPRDDGGEACGRGAGRIPERLLAAHPRTDAAGHAQCRDHRGGGAADGSQRRHSPEGHDVCGRHRGLRRDARRRRHAAGGASAAARQRHLASVRNLPHGRSVGPHGGDGFPGPGDRRGGTACVRRIADADGAVGQSQHSGADDRREDRRNDPCRRVRARPAPLPPGEGEV